MALYALDRITSFHIVNNLYTFCKQLSQMLCPAVISLLDEITSLETTVATTRTKIFDSALAKFLPNSSRLISIISEVGFSMQ